MSKVGITAPLVSWVLGSVLFLTCFKHGLAFHSTAMCAHLGQFGDGYLQEFPGFMNESKRGGYWTIGGKLNNVKWRFLDPIGYEVVQQFRLPMLSISKNGPNPYIPGSTYKMCPNYDTSDWKMYVNFCPVNYVEIDTYAVEQDGKVMAGWLHVEIKMTDPTDEIYGIYVQMRDEYFNAIGEFVTNPNEQCPPVNSQQDFVQPSKYQTLPCSAVGFREAKIAHALMMAPKFGYVNEKTLPDGFVLRDELKNGIRFTWRMSEYWCNRHYMIRPEAFILTKEVAKLSFGFPSSNYRGGFNEAGKQKNKNFYRRAADYWIRPRWFGAADIKLPHTTLKCDKKVIDYKTGKMGKDASGELVAPWFFEKSVQSTVENDYMSCQANPFTNKGLNTSYYVPTFSGRCTHHFKKNPSHDAYQGCNLNDTSEEFKDLPTPPKNLYYNDYVDILNKNRTTLCQTKCELPDNTSVTDMNKLRSFEPGPNFTYKLTKLSQASLHSRKTSKGLKLWQGHKYHAILCLIWTLFITPISITSARYYKETFMQHSCSGIHVWYWVHIGCLVAAGAMFGSSYSSMIQNIKVWGHIVDSNADLHRLLGWSSITIFVLMALLGGLRMGREIGQKSIRLAVMTLHSVVGFLQYFLNLGAIMVSCYFAGSPAVTGCNGDSVVKEGLSNTMIAAMLWFVFDFLYHCFLTGLQIISDRKRGIKRGWLCPMLPVLPPESTKDMKGSGLRKILFLVYVGVSFIFTIYAVSALAATPKDSLNCTYITTCTADYGCSKLAKRFAEIRQQSNTTEQSVSYG